MGVVKETYPGWEEVAKLAETTECGRIPVCRELYADAFTPVEVMRTLMAAGKQCFLLESAEQNRQWGRYSFLGYAPSLELTCTDGFLQLRRLTQEGNDAGALPETLQETSPEPCIRRLLRENKSLKPEGFPPFTGGLVGYFSYEYFHYTEPSLRSALSGMPSYQAEAGAGFRDVDLMLFDHVIVFDHYRQKLLLIAGVHVPEKNPADTPYGSRFSRLRASYLEAEAQLTETERLLKSGARADIRPLTLLQEPALRCNKEEFCGMVEKARQAIREGEIFQAVLSNPLTVPAQGSLFDVYRVLRTTNPSPYMFYLSGGDAEIAGASPETLVRLEDGVLRTYPLAGTRPRGLSPQEDERLERELLQDEKELAEHNMLVDLGRNDLGKISEPGSVEVERYLQVERFSHVMHLGSTVRGSIRRDKDALDAVSAVLPAGTLSGAPKIRACSLIGELEGHRRGIYGGAIGYLDFTGNMDVCIAIRLACKKNGIVTIQSGAGIVADSVPEKEFEECRSKAGAVLDALQQSLKGLR